MAPTTPSPSLTRGGVDRSWSDFWPVDILVDLGGRIVFGNMFFDVFSLSQGAAPGHLWPAPQITVKRFCIFFHFCLFLPPASNFMQKWQFHSDSKNVNRQKIFRLYPHTPHWGFDFLAVYIQFTVQHRTSI